MPCWCLGRVHRQEFFIPHTPFLYKTWYNRRTFTLFLLSKRFVVRTSKVLYPQFLYEIPFYVRGENEQIRNETMIYEAAVTHRESGRQPSLNSHQGIVSLVGED